MRSYDQFCGLALALDRIGDRWTLLLIRELLEGPRRFTQLRDALPGIASNLLSNRLERLQADGLVRQYEHAMGVDVYGLTPLGRSLEEPVHALVRWGTVFMHEPTPEQTFRPEWMILALRAMLREVAPPDADLCVTIQCGECAITIDMEEGEVALREGPPDECDLVLQGPPWPLFALVSGQMDPEEAIAHGVRAPVGRAFLDDWLGMLAEVRIPEAVGRYARLREES